MKALLELVRKELAQLRRDRLMLVIVFVSPVMQLTILGFAANLELQRLPLGVYDLDRSASSRAFAESFFHDAYFVPSEAVESDADVDRLLERGRAGAVLMIPRGFERDLLRGESPPALFVADGTESTAAVLAARYAFRIAGAFRPEETGRALAARSAAAPQAGSAELRVWYNPTLESRYFMVPGILALVLVVITMVLTSIAVVKEKEAGTLEQLIVSPLRPGQIILGKLLPFAAVGVVDMLLVLAVARFVFAVPIAGSVALLVGLSMVFVLTTLGLGLFISTVSTTQQQAMMTAVFFVMLPMVFLSGFVFPIENMPQAVQLLTYVLPLRYYFTIIRGIFLRGVGLEVLWIEAAALTAYGAAALTVSVRRFRKRLD